MNIEIFGSPFAKLTGVALAELFSVDHFVWNYLAKKISVKGPFPAYERIRDAYDLKDFFLYSQVKRFEDIGKCLYRETLDLPPKTVLLTIQAPHTHWHPAKPIIYKYDASRDRYIVGTPQFRDNDEFRPVSFLLHLGKIFPYEWVDKTISFSDEQWNEHYRVIEAIFSEVLTETDPVGIGIDFRYRHATRFRDQSSIEFPIEDEPGLMEFSQIISEDEFLRRGLEFRDTVRVGWPCVVTEMLGLHVDEVAAVNELRSAMSKLDDINDRKRLLLQLAEKFGVFFD